ncbi:MULTISPECIES: hypothetical protein [unclassified Kribbella]|uniref:hypothetical protein n=1 Tax=unclassified Kribbella TaxID=2644121 RepID=UPI00301796FB
MELMPEPDADLAARTLRHLSSDELALLVHRTAVSLPADPTDEQRRETVATLDHALPPDQALLAVFAVPDEILRDILHAELTSLGTTLTGQHPDPPLQTTALVEARLTQLTTAAQRT